MHPEKLEGVLGRKEHPWVVDTSHLAYKSVLVTGGEGSVGTGLAQELYKAKSFCEITDKGTLDVTNRDSVMDWCIERRPKYIFHLAGFKHAPAGEFAAEEVVDININGTANILLAAKTVGAKVVLASTCKAIEPETVYGSTKLIAERMTLHAGHSVARFFNVVETSGNVFEIWTADIHAERIPTVMDCQRYFISLKEACQLLMYASVAPGRFTINSRQRNMVDVAHAYLGDRTFIVQDRRAGDRETEPFIGRSEKGMVVHGTPFIKVVNYHD